MILLIKFYVFHYQRESPTSIKGSWLLLLSMFRRHYTSQTHLKMNINFWIYNIRVIFNFLINLDAMFVLQNILVLRSSTFLYWSREVIAARSDVTATVTFPGKYRKERVARYEDVGIANVKY
jgi:cytochrome c oxidase assembly factor CtaG